MRTVAQKESQNNATRAWVAKARMRRENAIDVCFYCGSYWAQAHVPVFIKSICGHKKPTCLNCLMIIMRTSREHGAKWRGRGRVRNLVFIEFLMRAFMKKLSDARKRA